ncbi:MAG TPA: hypothetical protein VH540_21060 [Ktedonobacterales bacterium]|jgi:hypothetical protein
MSTQQRLIKSTLVSMTPLLAQIRARWLLILLLAAVGIGLIWALSIALPPGIDWHETFRPAALAVLHSASPYSVKGFLNPPWAVLPFLPLALVPESIGRAIVFVGSATALGVTAYRLGARPLALAAFLLSPIVMHGLLNASVDWLVLVGFILPPQLGLFFVIIKPQVGFTLVLFWLVEAWRKGGLKEIARVFWPITVATLASLLVFGLWPLRFGQTLDYWWNASLWPLSIPVGLVLLVVAYKKRSARYAMGAAPCLSPYVLFHSWMGALVALAASQAEMVAAVIGLWVLVIIRAVG